jgi:DNA-binding transcriptional MerR regulator
VADASVAGSGGPEYRVDELAHVAGISVKVLRSYQSKGLLPGPRHEGRVALYERRHLDRLTRILELKRRGYSLKAIAGVLEHGWDGDAIATADDELLSLREVAERTRVPPAMLRSLEASGVLRPRRVGNDLCYTDWDVRAVDMLLALLGSGLPMEEFMRVARVQIEAASDVAGGAVELFLRFIREPLRARGLSDSAEAERLVAGFRTMLEATTELVAYNFQRTVLGALQAELDASGSEAERAALAREISHRRDAEMQHR